MPDSVHVGGSLVHFPVKGTGVCAMDLDFDSLILLLQLDLLGLWGLHVSLFRFLWKAHLLLDSEPRP